MRKLLTLLIVLLSSPAWATWTARGGGTGVQGTNAACASGGTTCAVTVTSTTGGDTLIATALLPCAAARTITAGSAGGSWVAAGSARNATISGCVAQAYVLSATGGVTTITFTVSGVAASGWAVEVRAYTSSTGGVTAEAVPTGTTSASCSNNCTTPTVTITGTNDLLVAGMYASLTTCSVAAPWAGFAAPAGDGTGHNLNTVTGTGGVFTQGSACPTAAAGLSAMVTVGFFENAAASTDAGVSKWDKLIKYGYDE